MMFKFKDGAIIKFKLGEKIQEGQIRSSHHFMDGDFYNITAGDKWHFVLENRVLGRRENNA